MNWFLFLFSQNLEDLLRDKEKDRKELAGKVERLQRDLQSQKQDKQQLNKGAAMLHEKLKQQTKQVGTGIFQSFRTSSKFAANTLKS